MSYSARKAAFDAIGETCPEVNNAFSNLLWELERLTVEEICKGEIPKLLDICSDAVKEQTGALRDALILAYEEKEESEEELKDQIYILEQYIKELENQIE